MKEIIKESKSKNGIGRTPNVKLFGRYIAKHSDVYDDITIYYFEKFSKEKINRFFEIARKYATSTNFGGDEYNKNSYIIIKLLDGKELSIYPPRTYGDNVWYRYNDILIEKHSSIQIEIKTN